MINVEMICGLCWLTSFEELTLQELAQHPVTQGLDKCIGLQIFISTSVPKQKAQHGLESTLS